VGGIGVGLVVADRPAAEGLDRVPALLALLAIPRGEDDQEGSSHAGADQQWPRAQAAVSVASPGGDGRMDLDVRRQSPCPAPGGRPRAGVRRSAAGLALRPGAVGRARAWPAAEPALAGAAGA